MEPSNDEVGNAAEPPADRTIDLAALKGLAHPLRVRILDTLTVHGPATASMLADRLGESSGATSYHLRQLARHDFVREMKDRGSARERWWERPQGRITLSNRDLPMDESTRSAARLVEREWENTRQRALDDFMSRADDVLAPKWLESSQFATVNMFLTAEELRDFTESWERFAEPFIRKYRRKPHPVGSRPVQVHFNAFPLLDGKEIPS